MKRIVAAVLLLLLPVTAFASCGYDNGQLFCLSASECPSGTTWQPNTGYCLVIPPDTPRPPAGSYIPAVYYPNGLGIIAWSEPKRALWTRSGNTVTVAGTIVQEHTAAGRAVFQTPLPIASRFSSTMDLAGVFTTSNGGAGVLEGLVSYPPGYAWFSYDVHGPEVVTVKYVYSYEILP